MRGSSSMPCEKRASVAVAVCFGTHSSSICIHLTSNNISPVCQRPGSSGAGDVNVAAASGVEMSTSSTRTSPRIVPHT